MTDEEHEMIQEILECAKKNNHWLFSPPLEGKPNRAQQLDELLSGVRAGKLGFRVALYLAGFVAAMGAAYGTLKGWFK